MTPPDYEYLRKLLKDHSGLDLSADKQYLIESRLLPLSRKAGLPGISELVQKMKGGSAALIAQVVEAMTTNETFFFRDKVPFDHFRDAIMPEILKARAGRKSIRIWCAAGSTGQEPYSLAMCLKEMSAALAGWRVEIIATDLSQEVLEKSKAGIYSQFEVQRGLPIQMLVKYFKQTGEFWQINPDIRAMVQHRQLNLLHDFSQLGTFDVIFCRNVLIYFDQDTKINIFNRLARIDGGGRLPGAGRGGNRGRPDRCLQAVSGPARPLPAERRARRQRRRPRRQCRRSRRWRDVERWRRTTRDRSASRSAAAMTSASWRIDGTWRRDCLLNAISDTDAMLTVEGSIQGLNLKEFFLLLSSTGLAYRRCELVRVNGTEMDVHFLKGKNDKKRPGAAANADEMMPLRPAAVPARAAIVAVRQAGNADQRRPADGQSQ